MYNMEQALEMEKRRGNRNSFYDVFEKCTQKEIENYKKMLGMPIIKKEVLASVGKA